MRSAGDGACFRFVFPGIRFSGSDIPDATDSTSYFARRYICPVEHARARFLLSLFARRNGCRHQSDAVRFRRACKLLGRWVVIMLVVNLLLTAAVSYYITRKLGSPLLAIRRVLNEISEGDDQEFSDIADALNLAVESMQQKISEAQGAAAIDTRDDQPVTDSEEIRQALSNCRIALQHFNTGSQDKNGKGDSSQNSSQASA